MDKKNLSLPLGQLSVEHIPPRLVEARQGWYFIFYQVDPSTGQLDRHRKSYNIGRINGITARRKRAKELLSQIEELLRVGYPWANGKAVYEFHRFIGAYKATAATTTVFEVEGKAGDVILETVEILCRSLREETTGRTYRSRAKLFVKWLEKKGWQDMPISNLKTSHVQAYMDETRLRVNNTTYNNYRRELGVVFAGIKKRGYIGINPVSGVATVSKVKKMRRAFEPEEAVVVLEEVYKTDYWLFMMIVLHCLQLFRKTECCRLRFRNFNLSAGTISLSEDDSKNHQACTVAIPDEALPFFHDNRFGAWPANWLVFGALHKPHPTKAIGSNTYTALHRDLLQRLEEEGRLRDITGLSLYSWKDTGMTLLAGILTPMKLKDHARHSTLDTTLLYYHGRNMVPEVKAAKFSILTGIIPQEEK